MDTLTRQSPRQTTCRMSGCTVDPSADHGTLHRTTNEGLLMAYASMTHQMDAATRDLRELGTYGNLQQRRAARNGINDLRARRAIVQAECLRRMGEQ